MLNEESEDKYNEGRHNVYNPVLTLVLAVMVEHVLDRKDVHLKL